MGVPQVLMMGGPLDMINNRYDYNLFTFSYDNIY